MEIWHQMNWQATMINLYILNEYTFVRGKEDSVN